MDDVIARLRAAAPDVLVREPVKVAYLFGSHARGEADHLSDVDVALLARASCLGTGSTSGSG